MKTRDLKNLLSESMDREDNLIQIIEEVLTIIFTDKYDLEQAKIMFEDDIEWGMENNGCFQGISNIIGNIERQKSSTKEMCALKDLTKS